MRASPRGVRASPVPQRFDPPSVFKPPWIDFDEEIQVRGITEKTLDPLTRTATNGADRASARPDHNSFLTLPSHEEIRVDRDPAPGMVPILDNIHSNRVGELLLEDFEGDLPDDLSA